MSVQISYKKQLAFGILGVLVILVVVEGIARVYEHITPGCRFLERDALKEMDISLQKQMCIDINSLSYDEKSILLNKPDQHFQTININSYGFRGPEISKEKPENVYRIFVVGGSTTFGFISSSDENTIPGFLQKKFNNANLEMPVEVINAGIAGSYSFREAFYIKNILSKFEPDLIIIYDGANDARYRIADSEPEKNESSAIDKFVLSFTEFPYYRTPFVIQNLLPKDFIFSITLTPYNEEIGSKVVSLWKSRLSEVCDFGKNEGFAILVALQPMVGTGNKILTSDEKKNGIKENTEGELTILKGMAESLTELDVICDETADLRSVFDDYTESIFFDQIHVTDVGNEIIAQKLFEIYLPIILEKTN